MLSLEVGGCQRRACEPEKWMWQGLDDGAASGEISQV